MMGARIMHRVCAWFMCIRTRAWGRRPWGRVGVVLLAASVGLRLGWCCSRRVWGEGLGGAARGECGESVESFFSRGRSAYVGFSCLFLLAPVRGGTSFLFKTRKET